MIGLRRTVEHLGRLRAVRGLRKSLDGLAAEPSADECIDFLFSDKAALIQPWQYPEEFRALARLVHARRPRTVLEIGTADGGTLFAHARLAAEDALIISVDLPEGDFGGGYPEWRIPIYRSFVGPAQRLHLLRADSHAAGTAEQLAQILDGRRVDYAFIDGDHSYDGVRQDFELCLSLASDDAVIAFHDIAEHPPETGCDVHRFWNDVRGRYRHEEFVRGAEQDCYGIGVLYTGPASNR